MGGWQYVFQLTMFAVLCGEVYYATSIAPTPILILYVAVESVFYFHIVSLVIITRCCQYVDRLEFVLDRVCHMNRRERPSLYDSVEDDSRINKLLANEISAAAEWRTWGCIKVLLINTLLLMETLSMDAPYQLPRLVIVTKTNLFPIVLSRLLRNFTNHLRARWLTPYNGIGKSIQ